MSPLQSWIRVDCRGNTNGVNAPFCTGEERLAFPVREEWGNVSTVRFFVEPAVEVVDVLASCDDLEELWRYLPARAAAHQQLALIGADRIAEILQGHIAAR